MSTGVEADGRGDAEALLPSDALVISGFKILNYVLIISSVILSQNFLLCKLGTKVIMFMD